MEKELLQQVIDSMEWMIKDCRWRFDECKDSLGDGSVGGYSPELLEAMETLRKVKAE